MITENTQEQMTQTKEEPEGLNQFEPRQNRNADEELKKWKIKVSEKTAGVSFLPNESRCCKTKFDDLKPIMLREMKVLKIHNGRYLVCKCISKPLPILGLTTSSTNDETYLKTGVNILIQDLNGDVEKEQMTQTKEEPEGLNQFEPRQNRNADVVL
uniref:Uncharacterized protein n=1 Tax=Panagrolaimus sp. PS1159 TaxID=55785 RepID=A0AC35GQL7_9BILA